MEVNVLDEGKNRLLIQINGEDHTFCNALKDELQQSSGVKAASYNIKHPLIGVPELIVETDGSVSPKQALAAAAKKLGKEAEKFKSEAASQL